MLKTYRVRLTARVVEDIWIDVQAESEADAEQQAVQRVKAGDGSSTFAMFEDVTVDSAEVWR